MSKKNLDTGTNQTEQLDLKNKLVYSNTLGGYILDVPEELRDKILVNHFGFSGDNATSSSMGMKGGCGGGSGAKMDPCGNICSDGQMICNLKYFYLIIRFFYRKRRWIKE